MMIIKDKVLVSITVKLDTNTVDIAWANRVIEDGNIIASVPDRGAFPLDDNGDPIGVDTTAIGAKLSQILTSAGAHAQSRIAKVESELASCMDQLEVAKVETNSLRSELETRFHELAILRARNNELMEAIDAQSN